MEDSQQQGGLRKRDVLSLVSIFGGDGDESAVEGGGGR